MAGFGTHQADQFLHGQAHLLHPQCHTDYVWTTGDAQLVAAAGLASHEGGIFLNDAAFGI
jgi:hypothetical protein